MDEEKEEILRLSGYLSDHEEALRRHNDPYLRMIEPLRIAYEGLMSVNPENNLLTFSYCDRDGFNIFPQENGYSLPNEFIDRFGKDSTGRELSVEDMVNNYRITMLFESEKFTSGKIDIDKRYI